MFNSQFWKRFGCLATVWSVGGLLGVSCALGEDLPAKVTFDEHIKPIFREHCTSCHNANDKKSGLALDNYASTMAGGSGGESLVVAISKVRDCLADIPFRAAENASQSGSYFRCQIALLKRWIEQGMTENSGSQVMARSRPVGNGSG